MTEFLEPFGGREAAFDEVAAMPATSLHLQVRRLSDPDRYMRVVGDRGLFRKLAAFGVELSVLKS